MAALIRDLVYFDSAKAGSLYSQLDDGLLTAHTLTAEQAKNRKRDHKFDIKAYSAGIGSEQVDKTTSLETRAMHHDLLLRLEESLRDLDILSDLGGANAVNIDSASAVRSAIGCSSYVRATGFAAIEDYERLSEFISDFNEHMAFFAKCKMQSSGLTDQIKELQAAVASAKSRASAEKHPDKRVKEQAAVKAAEQRLTAAILSVTQAESLPDWLVDGLKVFIDKFMPRRLNVRVTPFSHLPEFQVLANLKRDCLVDSDIENIVTAQLAVRRAEAWVGAAA